MLQKLLVANRGEIAVRVIRACRELGVRSVTVFSEADRLSPHVLMADEAYPIGPAPASESYLRIDALLEVARSTGCDSVHPGYGFLAERAAFAEAVESAGLVFVGPPSSAVAAMGDKTAARRRMTAAGVPVVPGTTHPLSDAAAVREAAASIGYPVLLKAAAGGGGKGMRRVEGESEVSRAFEGASHEALTSFGDASVYVEKYLDRPRHIEIQVLADTHGRVVSLGERECSIQRRHQKMIEEAPSPVVTPELRERMGSAAVAAASAVGYVNAGTIEFLFQDGDFYFLEMNTRIQVEHPVTELVTGIDLVREQLRIAAGLPMSVCEGGVRISGHALECRITGEDPANRFLPSTGTVGRLDLPGGPGVRWDGGIVQGGEVSLYYDPLLGKLIVHAPDRPSAIDRMARALEELRISGLATSIPFHRRVMAEPDFRRGVFDIRYVESHPQVLEEALEGRRLTAVVAAAALLQDQHRSGSAPRIAAAAAAGGGWRDFGWRR